MRAIKRWQADGEGRELTWPDHTDLCVWLLDQWTEAEAKIALGDAINESLSKDAGSPDALSAAREAFKIVGHFIKDEFINSRWERVPSNIVVSLNIPIGELRAAYNALAALDAEIGEAGR